MDNFLIIKRNFESDKESIVKYFKQMSQHRIPCWFVLFCEGHRLTAARLQESASFCGKRNIKPFKNVLCPRYKGFDLIMKSVEPLYMENIIDLTIFMEGNAP